MSEVVPSRRKRQRNSRESPGCSGPGPSHCREARDHSRPGKRKRRTLHLAEELSRAPLIVSSSGQLDQDSRSISQSGDEDESVLEVGRAGPPLSFRLTSRPISLDSSDTEGNREEASRGRSGTSPVGGAVVDLTNDSGVEDEDIVDLTSPIQLPPIVPEHEFLHERPSCRYADSQDSGGGRTTMTRSTVIRRPSSTPDVVIVQESDDEVQVINTPSGSLRRSKRPQPSSPPPPPPRSTKSSLTCPICMDTAQQFETSGRQLVTTVCGHVFCNTCIRNAIQRQHKCPTCRKKLTLKQYHPLFL